MIRILEMAAADDLKLCKSLLHFIDRDSLISLEKYTPLNVPRTTYLILLSKFNWP